MTYDAKVKAELERTDNWARQDDGKPLDFVVASALTTWEVRTASGPWFVFGDVWISRAEYVAHRIIAVIERAGGTAPGAALAIDPPGPREISVDQE